MNLCDTAKQRTVACHLQTISARDMSDGSKEPQNDLFNDVKE